MGKVQHPAEEVPVPFRHSELGQAQQGGVPVQQPQDNRFSVQHRDYRDPDVNLPPGDENLYPAILGQPFFGDVERTDYLETGDDCRLEAADLGRDGGILQNPVDPVPHAQFVFKGLEVNVGRPQFDRLLENLVDEPDDRGVLGGRPEVHPGFGLVGDHGDRHLLTVGNHRLHRVGADSEADLEPLPDLGRRGQNRLEFAPGGQAQLVDAGGVEEAAGSNHYRAGLFGEGQQLAINQNAGRENRKEFPARKRFFDIAVGNVEFGRQDFQQGFFGQAGSGQQRFIKRNARFA
ncbi:MAG: hypothetical protein BWY73_01216 [candidate division TA06 bacterium ADurb.Bin417]|uniref:Uncharacterized protein n=1 Tax=candidate division TA06 bacterium ADurb.Bin417 TaxID=1852828 RepID=A0A1V5MDM8_UNCT6|nr:MAG: hypothetical protein BWY73_01216 [candidate division TA06 bacterium ADurb.Bin417]